MTDLPPTNEGEAASLSALARSFRHQTIATLVTISNDPMRSDTARTMAARTLMEYDSGKPGNTRPPNVDDVGGLDDDQCKSLYFALIRRFETHEPGFYNTIIQQIVDQMLAKQMAAIALPRPNRFTRRAPVPAALAPEPPSLPPPAGRISRDCSAESAPAATAAAPSPTSALQPPLIASPARAGPGPDYASPEVKAYRAGLAAAAAARRAAMYAPPIPTPTPRDAAASGSNGLGLNGRNGNVVVLPGVARPASLTGDYYYDPRTRKLEKVRP
jgi:hypothetical protein